MNDYLAKQIDQFVAEVEEYEQPDLNSTKNNVQVVEVNERKDKQSRFYDALNELQYQIVSLLNLFKDLDLADKEVLRIERGIIPLLNRTLFLSEIEMDLIEY